MNRRFSRAVYSIEKKRRNILWKFLMRAFLLVFFGMTLFSSCRLTFAESTLTPEQEEALKKEQEKKKDEYDVIGDRIKTLEKIVNLKEKEESGLLEDARKFHMQSTALEGNITSNERKLADLGQAIETLESTIGEKERTISLQREILSRLLRLYYEKSDQAEFSPLIFLSSPQSVSDVGSDRDAFFSMGNGIQDALAGIIGIRDSLRRDRDLAGKKKVEIESVKLRLEQQNAYLESSQRKKEALAAAVAAEQDKYDTIISNLERQRKEIEDEIEQLDAVRAGKIDLNSIPSFSSGILGYPVKDHRKSQGYGKTTFTRWYTFHNGIDFADAIGTPILSAEKGKVVATGDNGKYAYGKWVAIEHENGLTTLYGHLSKQIAKKGERVDRGEKIGLMGSTGYSTGPHVHFSVFSSDSFEIVESKKVKGLMIPTGAHINPAKYL